jgi:hypothetical protein
LFRCADVKNKLKKTKKKHYFNEIKFEKVNLCSLVMWRQRVNHISIVPQKVVTEGGKISCNDSWYNYKTVMISF